MNHHRSFEAAQVALRLLAWYADCGRDLPWRRTRDPYCIWISEIMLQQTGVTAVIPYYERFLRRFPDLRTLAGASVDEVIALWAGLGYYSRARNLHAAACRIMAEGGGRLPEDLKALQALPGIGRSTAGAILSIAFNRKAPILDGNVRRVLIRLYAVEQPPRAATVEKELWRRAEELTPEDRAHDYAQAIMDLGATVCIPRQPRCAECPLVSLCLAHDRGIAAQLPRRQPRKTVPLVHQVALLLERDGKLLVRKRPLQGMLAGLWEFPCRTQETGQQAASAVQALLRGQGWRGEPRELGRVRHAYSHFRLEVTVFHLATEPACEEQLVAEAGQSLWLSRTGLEALALHGAHKKVRELLAGSS